MEVIMSIRSLITSDIADKIDKKIQGLKPNTVSGLKQILAKTEQKYKIEKVAYYGSNQGVRVHLEIAGRKFIIPKGNRVYSIFKD